jgi:hypothetical protein
MLFYRNTFPEFLEAICIGPNPSFLEKNTDACEFATSFPQEVELMYDWKSVKRSSNPLNALRNFTKKFIIYGPDLDVQTIKFFVQKVKNFPPYYSDRVIQEVGDAFDIANKKISVDLTKVNTSTTTTVVNTDGTTKVSSGDYVYDSNTMNVTNISVTDIKINNTPIQSNFITNNTSLNNDSDFLSKLANMLRGCNAPCNYFKPTSSSIGTMADFMRALSDSASVLGHAGDDALHAPINIASNIYNKIKPQFKSEFLKTKVLVQNLYRDGVKPFFSEEDRERMAAQTAQGKSPDQIARLPLTGDTSSYFTTASVHTQIQAKMKESLGDCYRISKNAERFNAYDVVQNAAYSKRKYIGVKNGNVKSLVDILGSAAPAQYATETTYKNTLDMPQRDQKADYFHYDDAPKAPTYNKYEGPSAGNEAVVTAGGSTVINAQTAGASVAGAGLENVPNTGTEHVFNFGEVKVTAYGYIMDECPDSGSEIGLGNSCNLLQSLKTVAINPENLGPGKMFKRGDVLIIKAEDRKGNVWEERRVAGDSSGNDLAGAGTGYKLLIDEFLPTKTGSKLYAAANSGGKIGSNLKLTIRVADTKQKMPGWNPADASISSPMFLNRNDWERVKRWGKDGCGFSKSKMDTEYIKFVKWSESDPLEPKFIAFAGCKKGGCNKWKSC